MNGIGSLLTLILLAALPIVLAYLWLVIRKYRFNMIWFLSALLAGILSVLITMCIQTIIPLFKIETLFALFLNIVARTALPEELSKFAMMFLLIALAKRWKRLNPIETKSDGAATGLVIALGFALFETAAYSMSNMQLTFLRAITAAPIHAACGIRTGMSAVSFKTNHTTSGIWNIILALVIHTVYNYLVLNAGTPIIFLVLLVAVSVISSLRNIKENIDITPKSSEPLRSLSRKNQTNSTKNSAEPPRP
ncbi:MAG: PrsW family intramembrane metalloprotease [Treponema sp.]|jgi:RsiW-degrading membrane proteinase PrsW (M82 family)|nr:PrsW family intramembrane metalloprotease [Treponema sp.]